MDVAGSAFAVVPPFSASVDMLFSPAFFTDNGVCFKDNNGDATCNVFSISDISGANLRYGRLALDSTYGPDTEALTVNLKAEYYDNGQWQVNTADSCTDINFTEVAGQVDLVAVGTPDITAAINAITSVGTLIIGQSDGLLLNAPNSPGELRLSLDPTASGVAWSGYLNFDWDGDGVIDSDDFPAATITFGQFRGNDKIIQWRELFN